MKMGMYDIFPEGTLVKCFPVFIDGNKTSGSLKSFDYGDSLPLESDDYKYPLDVLIVDFNYDREDMDFSNFKNLYFSIFEVKDGKLFKGFFTMNDIEHHSFDFSNGIVDSLGNIWKVSSLDDLKNLTEILQERKKAQIKFIKEDGIIDGMTKLSKEFREKLDIYR